MDLPFEALICSIRIKTRIVPLFDVARLRDEIVIRNVIFAQMHIYAHAVIHTHL